MLLVLNCWMPDGNLKLSFSSDYGASLYTDTDDPDLCPKTYVAIKLDGNEGGRRRSLSAGSYCDPTQPEEFNHVICEGMVLPSVCDPFGGPYNPNNSNAVCHGAQVIVRVTYVAIRCRLFGGWNVLAGSC